MSAWPSSVCTIRRSAPLCRRWLANAWRSTCGLNWAGRRPAAAASALSSRAKCWRVMWPLSPNDGNRHFDLAKADLASPDLVAPDFVAPDLVAPDLVAPDLASPPLPASA